MTIGAPPQKAHGRSRARRFVPLALAAWLVLEIWLLILVAEAIGGLTVLALLVGAAVLGGAVIKQAGRRAFRRLTETFQPGAATEPGSEGSGNALTMLGGLLLILPGFISDLAGLLCLVPPVRKWLGRYTERALERRMRRATPGSLGNAFQQARMHRPDGKIVQGEVIREDTPQPPSPGDQPRPPLTS
ncbi:FxsA family protein [Streptomyces sannanensis]|uniref:FxsA family protein n=1 Tax=Streptomyces sannanensis TaxID=285536 RepID=A0ABP6S6Q3_9ACTN